MLMTQQMQTIGLLDPKDSLEAQGDKSNNSEQYLELVEGILDNYQFQYFFNPQTNQAKVNGLFDSIKQHISSLTEQKINFQNLEYSEFPLDLNKQQYEEIKKYKKIFFKLNKFEIFIQKGLLLQLSFPQYLRVSISTLRKAVLTTQLPQNIVDFILHSAQYKHQNCNEDELPQKIRKLCQEFYKLDRFQLVSQDNLLYQLESDHDSLQNSVWTRQQIIQCLVLYSIIKCELLILNFAQLQPLLVHQQQAQEHTKLCTYDYSWSENCHGNIRDYHPKLAKKLNKRYQIARSLSLYDKETSKAIFNYAQSLLGYYHHHYSYSQMQLNQELKDKIKAIVNGTVIDCEIGLVIIVANARMFVQILYALK